MTGRPLRPPLWLALLLSCFSGVAIAADAATPASLHFENNVRPLLASQCWTCHGSEAKSGLRLDSREGVLAGGSRGPAVLPGQPDKSLLMQAVRRIHDELKMPPNGELGPKQIDALERWIREGAVWPQSDHELFTRQVWPLLQRACLSCHGEEKPENGLRLDSREATLKGGKTGPALIPGKPDDSIMIQAVRWDHPEFDMPLEEKLPARDIAILENWVARGAPWFEVQATASGNVDPNAVRRSWRKGWSYQTPRRATFTGAAAGAGELDQLVLAKLKQLDLPPTPVAPRDVWLRRVSYVLTGLPPSPEKQEAFLAANGPETAARAAMIQELLGSKAYAQRWADLWTDELLGRVIDDERDRHAMSAYRSWVARALGQDLRYDVFVRAHLLEGGPADPTDGEAITALWAVVAGHPEYEQDGLDARADAVGRAFLGLDIGCARCHNHRYEPIDTADYAAVKRAVATLSYPDRASAGAGPSPHATESVPLSLATLLAPGGERPGETLPMRAQLAALLAHNHNPVVARVIVNRVWKHLFGQALTGAQPGMAWTLDRFGHQLRRPVYWQVLDHLAAGLVANGWSLKWLHTQILSADVWALSVAGDEKQMKRDPDNLFLWRANLRPLGQHEVGRVRSHLSGEAADRPVSLHARSVWKRVSLLVPKRAAASEQVRALYRLVLARSPDQGEIDAAVDFLKKQGGASAVGGGRLAEVLLTCNEFETLL